MLIIGSSFHIIPKLADTELASEKNGTLVSALWTLAVLLLVIAAHDSEILGINIFLLGTTLHGLAYLAVLINLLLTASERKSALPLPGWLIMLGILARSCFCSGSNSRRCWFGGCAMATCTHG